MAELSPIRDENGLFKRGNPGGPGRPPRAIEQDYLRAISEKVPLETWCQIIDVAVRLALEGDDKARAWLSKYLLGDHLPGLARIAALDAEGVDPVDQEVEKVRNRLESDRQTRQLLQQLGG